MDQRLPRARFVSLACLILVAVALSGCTSPSNDGDSENVDVQNNTPAAVQFDVTIRNAGTGAVVFEEKVSVQAWETMAVATLPEGEYRVRAETSQDDAERVVEVLNDNRILISQGQNVGLEIHVIWDDSF